MLDTIKKIFKSKGKESINTQTAIEPSYNVLGFVKRPKEPIVVPLKRYEKSELEKALDRDFGNSPRSVYDDIRQTYLDAIFEYAQTEIVIQTDLVAPQVYKFANEEVTVIN